jgi:hypothetical protein
MVPAALLILKKIPLPELNSARVVELVDTQDLKSCSLNSCTGSIPVPGTFFC